MFSHVFNTNISRKLEKAESGMWYEITTSSDATNTNSNWKFYFLPQSFEVSQVIFQDELKTTIVIWSDGTKTVVKCMEEDTFVPEIGFAMAVTKKIFGDRGSYLKLIKNASHQKVFKK
jgi:hypothetical protein